MLKPYQVFFGKDTCQIFQGAARFLGMNVLTGFAYFIKIPSVDTLTNRSTKYCKGPFKCNLYEVQEALRTDEIISVNEQVSPLLALTDDQQIETQPSKRKKESVRKDIERRDIWFSSIQPVLLDSNNEVRLPIELIEASNKSALISRAAKSSGLPKSTIYTLLNRYWAGGGVKNSLRSYLSRCGNPGQDKKQDIKKLGRPKSRSVHVLSEDSFLLSDEDKHLIGIYYKTVSNSITVKRAYTNLIQAHWSNHSIDAFGKMHATQFDSNSRPSRMQFEYWGKKINQVSSVRQLKIPETKWLESNVSAGGSTRDQVSMVCQLAGFDSTPIDLYTVSMLDRTKALTPANRFLLIDIRTTYIIGWLVTYEKPSSQLALQTIFFGASSKVEHFKKYGIEVRAEDYPPVLPKRIQADNGELKADRTTEAENQFGFSVTFVKTGQGSAKGDVESTHHKQHKSVDHALPGSTLGKRRERGEKKPVLSATLNYFEYMTDLLQDIHTHNTLEVVPRLAPIQMLNDHPEIKPTRANIFNWMRERGMTAEQPANQEAMRAYLQESVPAVIHKNGLFLQTRTGSQYKTITFVRYSTSEQEGLALMSKVKSSGHRQRVEVFINKENPSQVWLATSAGLIMWTWQVDEQDYELRNYWDLLNIASRMSLDSSLNEEIELSHDIQTQTRRKQVLTRANREKNLALDKSGISQSQSTRAKHLKENTAQEILLLRPTNCVEPKFPDLEKTQTVETQPRRLSANELMRMKLLGK